MPRRKKEQDRPVITQGYIPHPTRIGRLLGEVLKKAGWTQVELARILDLSPSTVCKLLSGRRITENLSVLRKISELLGKPIDGVVEAAYLDRKEAIQYVLDQHRRASKTKTKEKKDV